MITFKKAQSIALWMHIPMWFVVSLVIIIIGAYHAGIREAEAKQTKIETQSAILPIMTLEQLTQIKMSDL
jgi:hypothetical protein